MLKKPVRLQNNTKSKHPNTDVSRMGSDEKFRRMATVIQDSNDAITFQDLDGNILAWNRGAEQIYGYSEVEALDMNIVDIVPTNYQEEQREFLSALKRGELVSTLETKRKTKDGRIVDVWLTNTKLTDDKGNLTGIATTERDISERKKSEASLQEKFRELNYLREGQIALSEKMRGEQLISKLGQSILSHLVPFTNAQIGGFYIVNDDKKLKLVACFGLEISECTAEPIEFGDGLVGQVAVEKHPLLKEGMLPSFANNSSGALGMTSLLICPILYENNVIGVIELASSHSFSDHHRIFLSHVSENIGIAINTSVVRKKIQKQNEALNKAQVLLEEKASELEKASRYKTEFLTHMSHEIRTPIGAILGFSDLLKSPGNSKEEDREYMTVVERNCNQLLRLIDDILDLSKVEAGKMTFENIEFSLPELMADFTSAMRLRAIEKKIKFDIKTSGLIPDFVYSDPHRLRQILNNVVGNAIKFTNEGYVELTISFSGSTLRFECRDTGIGISKAQEEKLFQPFSQADQSTTRKYGGTGLGLVLSRNIAESLGGKLELLLATENVGSTFVIEVQSQALPHTTLVGSDALAIGKGFHKNQLPRLVLNGLKVLLVEDSPDNQFLITTYLNKEGAEVTSASDGAEGAELAMHGEFDVLLMDIQMPILDGHEATKKLRASQYKKPIIALTAHAMLEERTKCLQSGFTEFLTKPIQRDSLIETLIQYVPSL